MKYVIISTPTIKLDQFMKFADLCGSGGEAKELITNGFVLVNGEKELRRGKKLKDGDVVRFRNAEYQIRQDGGTSGNKEASFE